MSDSLKPSAGGPSPASVVSLICSSPSFAPASGGHVPTPGEVWRTQAHHSTVNPKGVHHISPIGQLMHYPRILSTSGDRRVPRALLQGATSEHPHRQPRGCHVDR